MIKCLSLLCVSGFFIYNFLNSFSTLRKYTFNELPANNLIISANHIYIKMVTQQQVKIPKPNYETNQERIAITEREPDTISNRNDIRETISVNNHWDVTVKLNSTSRKDGTTSQKIALRDLQILMETPIVEVDNRGITLNSSTSEKLEFYSEGKIGSSRTMLAPTPVNNGSNDDHNYTPENMVFVRGGSFQMGSNEYDLEKPIHQVTVSDFYIGMHEVTQKEWKDIMGGNPSKWKGERLPVERIRWYDAVEFCNKKSEEEGLQKCYSGSGQGITCDFSKNGYRLPTEAEWEYAARGGNESENPNSRLYSGSNNIGDVAWYNGNSNGKTHQVGTKQANELGIYDMSGNVWEWCWDWYGEYYSYSQINPGGADSGDFSVLRGGSWNSYAGHCRVSNRHAGGRNYCYDYIGFRIARTVK